MNNIYFETGILISIFVLPILGVFAIKKFEVLKKIVTKRNTIILSVLFFLILLFKTLYLRGEEASYSIFLSIGLYFGVMFIGAIIYFLLFLFKYKERKFYEGWFCLLLIYAISISLFW